uniref:RING-type domain-containing protein n=1 Tax=Ciona savignyi TaxID=51511 RepID=H2ZML6_CIOSA
MARSGFFYLGNRDRTQCFNCMGVLKNWRPGDDINTIHSESFPTCSPANDIYSSNESESIVLENYAPEPNAFSLPNSRSDRATQAAYINPVFNGKDMFPCIDPKRPSMKFYEDRISSFEGKWTHSGPPTISDIAKAGFFLFDVDASVRCWYCDVVVSDVSRQWSPWEEHAKQYPSCHFLLRNRGHNFVEAALSSDTACIFVVTIGSTKLLQCSELRRLRDEKRCKVCLDRDAEMVFIPCGHLSTCLICTQSLRQCPVCRMKINRSYRTFPS